MILTSFEKQPAERKDYDIDYAEWLAPVSDSLYDITTAVVCQTDPTDTTLVVASIDMTATTAKLWVTGGTDGQKYKIDITAETHGGRIDQSEVIFKVKEY